MDAKFTPGPWSVNEIDATGEPSKYYIFIEPGVAVIERKIEGQNECDFHDARLIAAAPDLLEALQDIADYPEHDTVEMKRIARAAIAKATGESK